jgi:hypothetical protein
VKEVVDVKGNKYLRIRYADGDEEDIWPRDLAKILVKDDDKKVEKKQKKKGEQRAVSGVKKKKGSGRESEKRALAPTTAPAAAQKQRRKLSQPSKSKHAVAAAEPAEEVEETEVEDEEEEEEFEKMDEGEEEESEKGKEKSPFPASAAAGSARAHISSMLHAGKKMLIGDGKGEQEHEEQEKSASAGPSNRLQAMLTQNEGEEEEVENGEEQEQEDIAPHEFLHPSPTSPGRKILKALLPQQKQQLQEEEKKEEEVEGIQRIKFSGPPPTDGISASAAVAANGLLFIGALTRPGIIPYDQETNTPPDLYEQQILEIFEDLDKILKKVNVGKESLLSVDVQFKDSAVGYAPFVAQWNKWLGTAPAPVSFSLSTSL